MKPLSTLIESVPGSVTTAMMQKGRELAAAGKHVINLAGGEPDFDTPKHIQEAAFEAIRRGDTHYPPSAGTPALLDAIVGKLARENNVQVKPSQILVTPGAKWAIYASLAAMLNPGDEVLILEPAWVSYNAMVALQRAVPVSVPLSFENNFTFDEETLLRYLTPKTKLIMVCSPNNPNGRVLSQKEQQAIVNIATEYNLYVMSDEIYEHIIYEGATHTSLASLPGMAERTIIINGFSKAYAMTGWRLGWLAAPPAIAKAAREYQTQSITSAAAFTMAAGVAALNGPQDCVRQMTAAYTERRRFVQDALDEIPGIEAKPIDGAFYVFPKFTNTRKSSVEIANILLEDTLISNTPGVAFGMAGEGHIRFSIAAHLRDLEIAMDRLAKIVPSL